MNADEPGLAGHRRRSRKWVINRAPTISATNTPVRITMFSRTSSRLRSRASRADGDEHERDPGGRDERHRPVSTARRTASYPGSPTESRRIRRVVMAVEQAQTAQSRAPRSSRSRRATTPAAEVNNHGASEVRARASTARTNIASASASNSGAISTPRATASDHPGRAIPTRNTNTASDTAAITRSHSALLGTRERQRRLRHGSSASSALRDHAAASDSATARCTATDQQLQRFRWRPP